MLTLAITHPMEFRTLVQFWMYYEQKRDISAQQEHATSGWDRESMRRCWAFLDLTSRSFSAVIKELEGDLARTVSKHAKCHPKAFPEGLSDSNCTCNLVSTCWRPCQICMFYLVLRGLDTIEDDMTIPDGVKQPLLRSFHEKTVTPGWNFKESGPNEKDRQLLVEYDTIIKEVNLLAPE